MKFLNINATISVKPQFSGEVIKAGTPLDISGSEANSDAAVGIVASDTAVGAESIAIVTEGTIDLTELTASYGSALTDECIAALKGITFLYGGKAVVPSGGGGGGGQFIITITENEERTELSVDKTYSEIDSAYAAGKTFLLATKGLVDADPFFARSVILDESGYKIRGGYTTIEAVSEDTADVSFWEYSIFANSENGVVAYLNQSYVSGSYSSIPPVEF